LTDRPPAWGIRAGRCHASQAPHHPGRHGKLGGTLRDVYERLTAEGLPVLPPKVTDRGQAGFDNQLGAYAELRDAIFGMKTFGASAPLKELLVKTRFTGDNVYVAAKHQLARKE